MNNELLANVVYRIAKGEHVRSAEYEEARNHPEVTRNDMDRLRRVMYGNPLSDDNVRLLELVKYLREVAE